MAWELRQPREEEFSIQPFMEEAMSIPRRIREYLEYQNVPYIRLPHPEAFTAQEMAHTLHISGKPLAKTVVVEADGRRIMAVLPASHRLVLSELRAALNAHHVDMLHEDELVKAFPDCDLGAIPPFGNLYGMDVWVDRSIADQGEIVFNAGTHADVVRMNYHDFAMLAKPRTGRFSETIASAAA